MAGILDQTSGPGVPEKVQSSPSLNSFVAGLSGLGVGIASLVTALVKAASLPAAESAPQAAVIDGAFLLAAVGVVAGAWVLVADFRIRADVKKNAVGAAANGSAAGSAAAAGTVAAVPVTAVPAAAVPGTAVPAALWVRVLGDGPGTPHQVLDFRGRNGRTQYLIQLSQFSPPEWVEQARLNGWQLSAAPPAGS
jgi:hypothetical protein